MKYLVVYDISKNKNREQVFKILSNYGRNIQKSVFEIETEDISEIEKEIKKLVDNTKDKLFIVPISKKNSVIVKLGRVISLESDNII